MTDATCIFCKIIRGEIPTEKLYEDENFIVIRDINPIAKYHYLVIPKQHYRSLDDMNENNALALSKVFMVIPKLKELLHLENGYRLVINQGEDAGQTVGHLHIHILAGQVMNFSC